MTSLRVVSAQQQHAEGVFRDTMAPLLALAEEYPTAGDLCIDGSHIKLDIGDEWKRFSFADFPKLKPRDIEAAASAAASHADIEFGPQRHCKHDMSVWMPPDLRVSVVCPPISDRWYTNIRFLRSVARSLESYIAADIMTASQALELRLLVSAKQNLVVTGGTGSGKTTLLRTLIELVKDERLAILEDTPELNVPSPDIMHWSTIAGGATMSDLLKQSLRMRPDRIIIGEVKGAEALELVRAMNTGHDGTMGTLHSNGFEDTIDRLETMVLEGQPTFPTKAIRRAIHYDVHLEGRGSERRLSRIWKVPRE